MMTTRARLKALKMSTSAAAIAGIAALASAILAAQPTRGLTPEDYYADFALGMRDIDYDGYIGYELCHPLPPGSDLAFADLNAQLAVEYMRSLRDFRLAVAD